MAETSAGSAERSHRSFTSTHVRTYSHRYAPFGGNHSAGSRAPLDRLELALTAIKDPG